MQLTRFALFVCVCPVFRSFAAFGVLSHSILTPSHGASLVLFAWTWAVRQYCRDRCLE